MGQRERESESDSPDEQSRQKLTDLSNQVKNCGASLNMFFFTFSCFAFCS